MTTAQPQETEISVIGIKKFATGECYVFLFDDAHRKQVLQQMALFAVNPNLSFDWYDCARLSQRVRNETKVKDDFNRNRKVPK